MRVSVFDTYVKRDDGRVMHFDILVSDTEKDLPKIYGFGKEFLKTRRQEGQPLDAKECRFCHIENATPEVEKSINEQGYYIIEMENCR